MDPYALERYPPFRKIARDTLGEGRDGGRSIKKHLVAGQTSPASLLSLLVISIHYYYYYYHLCADTVSYLVSFRKRNEKKVYVRTRREFFLVKDGPLRRHTSFVLIVLRLFRFPYPLARPVS